MATSLYDLTVPTFEQTLGALAGVLDKGLAHAEASGLDPESIVETRLAPDMHPFRFQVQQVCSRSLGAIEAIRTGAPAKAERAELDYAGLQALVADARARLAALSREEIDGLEDREVALPRGEAVVRFKAAEYVLSHALPNFYFHAATAYDILRHLGAPLGKRDFMGVLRTLD